MDEMLTAVFGTRLKKYHYLVKFHFWMCVALILVVVCTIGIHGLRRGTAAPSLHRHIFEAVQSNLLEEAGLTSATCVDSRLIKPSFDAFTVSVAKPAAALIENVQLKSELNRKHLKNNKFFPEFSRRLYSLQGSDDDGVDRSQTSDSVHPGTAYSADVRSYLIVPHPTFRF